MDTKSFFPVHPKVQQRTTTGVDRGARDPFGCFQVAHCMFMLFQGERKPQDELSQIQMTYKERRLYFSMCVFSCFFPFSSSLYVRLSLNHCGCV